MAVAALMLDEDFAIKLSRCSTEFEEIAEKAIFAGVEIVADAMRINLEGVLSDEATGQLVDALGVTPIGMMGGEWSAHIGFDGYDKDHVAFQLIARVLESGTSRRQKKPFVRKTMNQTRTKVAVAMQKVVDEEMAKILD